MRQLIQVHQFVIKCILIITIILFVAMAGSIFLQVILRYIFSIGIHWADELSRYLLVWITFLGASVAIDNIEETAMTFIKQRLPHKATKAIVFLYRILTIGFLIILFIVGLRFADMGKKTQTIALGGITMNLPFLAIPVGSILMAYNYIMKMIIEHVGLKAKTTAAPGGKA